MEPGSGVLGCIWILSALCGVWTLLSSVLTTALRHLRGRSGPQVKSGNRFVRTGRRTIEATAGTFPLREAETALQAQVSRNSAVTTYTSKRGLSLSRATSRVSGEPGDLTQLQCLIAGSWKLQPPELPVTGRNPHWLREPAAALSPIAFVDTSSVTPPYQQQLRRRKVPR